jgi:glycerol-3-phosphate acyltransferase PlsY
MDSELLRVIAVVAASYLLGSLPSAYVIAKLRRVNIFEVGSGNMGATNVARAIGFGWGLMVWLFDSVKGMAAIILARQIMSDNAEVATAIAAIVAIIGHNWSLFATLLTGKLRGGKGAATAFGTVLMIVPLYILPYVLLAGGAAFAVIFALTRYVSLGVLIMFGVIIGWMLILVSQRQLDFVFMYYSLMVAALILLRFRENIQRILAGRERRFGEHA